jgi:hypothetical protein
MKAIEEFMQEKKKAEEELNELLFQKQVLTMKIVDAEILVNIAKEKISNYEKEKQKEEELIYFNKILNWITGQTESTYNLKYCYEGIVCPSLKIYEYKSQKPIGTQDEIISLLKEKGYEMLTFSTNFHPCGSWGDNILEIHLHKKL